MDREDRRGEQAERLVRLRGRRAGGEEAAEALAADLAARIDGEVRFDNGSRALYATAGSNYRQLPIGVVIPRSIDDVIEIVATCREHHAPLLSRGGGTSLAGQCCNVAVVMDFSKYLHHLLTLDPARKRARVQPGLVLDDLRGAANRFGLTFGPDPATHNHCTLGGMIGNNSCGVHSVMAGRTADNVEELEILTYDGLRMRVGATPTDELERIIAAGGRRGEIYRRLRALADRYAGLIRARYPKIPRRVSGYNLDELLPENGFQVARALVGSEGTLVTVLEATVRLVDWPPARSLLVLGYPSIDAAADRVREVMAAGPIGLEGMDHELVRNIQKKQLHADYLKMLPGGRGWLLVEFGGASKEESDGKARALMDRLRQGGSPPEMKLFDDLTEEEHVWKLRESGLGATARVPGEPDTWEGWEDSAVPPDKLGEYLRVFQETFKKHGLRGALYGHFGQGCVHTRINFDLMSDGGIRNYRAFVEEMADHVVRLGGSLSGEHGDGQSRAELLPKMFGDELMAAMREFKAIWDPEHKMNPGKVVEPYRLDENLRFGRDYEPRQPATWFQFPDDDFTFVRGTTRCVGVGLCRREEHGTMCPSYKVTREEMHSTRGRAHLLFEMLRGEELDGWRDEHVKEALDLCLACKGCKGDCPVNVDLATYKSEFLAHYYEGRLRPRAAYAMGLIRWWAGLASLAPGVANLFGQTEPFASWLKRLGGVSPERRLPPFARRTFRARFRSRPRKNPDGPEVMLFPDTFNDHFHPETALAAVDVLEQAGWRVTLPRRPLCCGRPLYDYGFLDLAKRWLQRILVELKEPIERGVPMVVLEPSCLAVFQDELRGLYPNDPDGRRLRQQVYSFGQFLSKHASGFEVPPLPRKALVHGHCHQKALDGIGDESELLRKMQLDVEVLDSGCCGMAGSFGFETDKYEVSMKVGELVLLPKVREAPKETLVVADGFSCREQIEMGTDRQAMHLAEVVKLGLDARAGAPARPYPERGYVRSRHDLARIPPKVALGAVAAVGLLFGIRWLRRR